MELTAAMDLLALMETLAVTVMLDLKDQRWAQWHQRINNICTNITRHYNSSIKIVCVHLIGRAW